MSQTEIKLAKQAERVMRNWLVGEQVRERLEQTQQREAMLSPNGPYIVLSREAGLGTSQIAHLVGKELEWQVLDHELLQLMADHYNAPTQLVGFLDEKPANWLSDMLEQGIAHHEWSNQTFVHRVAKILQLAGNNGKVVIVGRGAQYILPHDKGFFARLIGPREHRINNVAQRDGMTATTAVKYVDETDETRRQFIQQYFHHDLADPLQYDLIINVARFGPENTARQIASTFRLCQEHEAQPANIFNA